MNNIEFVLTQPIFQALGWALIHFIWQGALVAILFGGASYFLSRNSANLRYATACGALLVMLGLPVITGVFIYLSSTSRMVTDDYARGQVAQAKGRRGVPRRATENSSRSASQIAPIASTIVEAAPFQRWAEERFAFLLPWLICLWLTGTCALSLRFLGGWVVAQRLRRRVTKPATRAWQQRLTSFAQRIAVSRAVRLCESTLVEVPTVIGWLRPVILMPPSALLGLTTQQVEALLAHELAHIRRHDYLVNLLQTLIETLLFYHPAVWWISHQIRVEREHACDDAAVRACGGDVLTYARALVELERLRFEAAAPPQLAMAAGGSSRDSLLRRVQRLVEVSRARPARAFDRSSPWAATAVVVISVLSILASARAALLTDEVIAAFTLTNLNAVASEPQRRKAAVIFVSLPPGRGYRDDAHMLEDMTRKLVKGITTHHIPAVGFVGEGRLYRGGEVVDARVDSLRIWLDAGLELGNQTFSHPRLYNTPLASYQEDIIRGERITSRLLSERGMRLKYFSYPFLNTGPNLEAKTTLEKFLAERGYRIAPVTIDNMDWLFVDVYARARDRGDGETMRRVAEEYIPYMEKMMVFYEELSVDVLGREIPQVLMLTAGALNADLFDNLVQMMKRRGYAFVSLDQALRDEAYQMPDTYTGPTGISWLQRWAITRGGEFRKEPYLPPYMKQFDFIKSGSSYKTEKD